MYNKYDVYVLRSTYYVYTYTHTCSNRGVFFNRGFFFNGHPRVVLPQSHDLIFFKPILGHDCPKLFAPCDQLRVPSDVHLTADQERQRECWQGRNLWQCIFNAPRVHLFVLRNRVL
jgi:hypothetical protein